MSPRGSCFVVGPNDYFDFEVNYASKQITTALGAFSGFHERCILYDRDGHKWSPAGIDLPFSKTWWRLLLARTVFNPSAAITVRWQSPVKYDLSELKVLYLRAVEGDDDCLTQFAEAVELKRRIDAASSFQDLADVYRWAQTDSSNG